MELENMAANAVTEAGTQGDAAPESTAQQTEDSAAAVQTTENPADTAAADGDVTQTQAFARRLKEQSQKEADRLIADLGMSNPVTGEPIRNRRDLLALKRMQEAESLGRDPEEYARTTELQSRLADYEMREQEQAIMANPRLAPLYEQFGDEVRAITDRARADGQELSLESALRVVIAQNYDAVLDRAIEEARNEATRSYNAQRAASPGALGGAETGTTDVARMSDAAFESYLQKVKRGEVRL